MQWMKHSKLEGKHAIFTASQPAWLHYDDDKILEYLQNKMAADRGTQLHAWAAETIRLGIKQHVPRGKTPTIQTYINDAIGWKMDPEVVLYYSDYFFGTADAISFRDGKLRIHDLKTGRGPVKDNQLIIYAALFCLEYREDPHDLREISLRFYQNDEIVDLEVTPDDIQEVMDRIVEIDKKLKLA